MIDQQLFNAERRNFVSSAVVEQYKQQLEQWHSSELMKPEFADYLRDPKNIRSLVQYCKNQLNLSIQVTFETLAHPLSGDPVLSGFCIRWMPEVD